MSSEDPTAQPAEVPAEATAPVAEETPVVAPATDAEVAGADTAPADDTTAAAPDADAAATGDAPAAAEETPAEAAPAAPEKKEGSSFLGLLKKRVTQSSKSSDKKAAKEAAKAAAPPAETSAPAEEPETPAVTELPDDKPLESESVEYKVPGGFFIGGWKSRVLSFGKDEGYSQSALGHYISTHKSAASPSAVCDNAAHATVTGSGLLFVTKPKAHDVPLSIINLADVTSVTAHNGHFTVKTEQLGEYEFNAGFPKKAQRWKDEIEKRADGAKAARSGVQEHDKYKESYAYFKDEHKAAPSKAPEPVTSDEEGGEEAKRSNKWARRISGSFQRITGSSKDASKEEASEAKKDESSAPAATEAPAAAETSAAPETTTETAPETTATEAPVEAPTESAPETKKEKEKEKEKRKSFSGFATGLWKSKAATKEVSPEPAPTEETTETPAPADTEAADTTAEAPVETPAQPEETTTAAPTEAKADKSKRSSIFMSFLPKKESKDKATSTTLTNGEAEAPKSTDAAPTTSETAPAPTEEAEYQPPPQKKHSLSRRLTNTIKSLGRSKSPDKGKSTKVPDEAPKIDTAIESTSDPVATADVEPETKAEEPLATTEAPLTSEDVPATSEPPAAPEVSAQA